MFCIMSVDLGAVTFLHWIQMAAALLSVGLSLTKGCCFRSLFSFHTPASLARSSCRGIRMKLWEYLFYSLSIMVWTLILSISFFFPVGPLYLMSWTHDMVPKWFICAFLTAADASDFSLAFCKVFQGDNCSCGAQKAEATARSHGRTCVIRFLLHDLSKPMNSVDLDLGLSIKTQKWIQKTSQTF